MSVFKSIVARSANTAIGWSVIARLGRLDRKLQSLLRFAERHRALNCSGNFYARVRAKFSDQQVRHGPFAGLRYGGMQSRGSTLLPKLLGSYENELHPWLETFSDRGYGAIVDIGCAEGYYAIGLGRLLPGARVYAYDTEPASRDACKRLARENGVDDRLVTGAFCSAETLKALDPATRTLIVSDCEGYEANLFDADTAAHLANADLLIECHDHIGQPILQNLVDLFAATHDATIVPTVPDHRKALDLAFPEFEGEAYPVRLYMVEEQRGAPQNFLILEARATG